MSIIYFQHLYSMCKIVSELFISKHAINFFNNNFNIFFICPVIFFQLF